MLQLSTAPSLYLKLMHFYGFFFHLQKGSDLNSVLGRKRTENNLFIQIVYLYMRSIRNSKCVTKKMIQVNNSFTKKSADTQIWSLTIRVLVLYFKRCHKKTLVPCLMPNLQFYNHDIRVNGLFFNFLCCQDRVNLCL